jgi:hypothetical protein
MPYPVATLATVRGRLISALNAGEAGAWSTTVPATASGDKRRSTEELTEAVLAADARVCRTIAGTLGHGYRSTFLQDSAEIEHGGLILPTHIGPPEQVLIQATDAGVWIAGKHDEAVTLPDIERWRANAGSVYGSANHNAEGSPLAGYYVVMGSQIFFTGAKAKCQVAVFTKVGVCQGPMDMEDLILALAYIAVPKEGDKGRFLSLFQGYAAAGLEEIKAGAMVLPPLQMAQEAVR